MKNLILIFIILLSLFGLEIYSQCDLNSIIFKLNSNDRALRIEAINDVRDCNESSAIPYMEDRLHIENDYHIALRLLWALDALNAENIVSDALDLFSYFEEGKFSKEVSYVNKLLVLDILFRRGNFSKGYILFDFWERYPNSYDLMTLRLLEMLIQNDSTVNQNGAAILEEAFELNIGIENKVRIMKILSRNYGPKETDFFLNLVFNDPEILIRSTAINCLVENNYPGNPELLINRLYDDSSENIRKRVAKILLFQWGTPSTYKVVSSSSLMSHNANIKDILQYYLKFFKPKDVDGSVDVRIDSLNNNLEELIFYNWLGDLTFSNELKNILNAAKTNLVAGDSIACRIQIKEFQNLVDNVYKDSLNTDPRFITIEGWKFLYWHAQYILDRFP